MPLSKQRLTQKKVVKSGPSRRLVVIMAFLLIYTQSSPFSSWFYTGTAVPSSPSDATSTMDSYFSPLDSQSGGNHDNHNSSPSTTASQQVVWLTNAEGLCMNAHGFSQCGDSNAWQMKAGSQLNSYFLAPYFEHSSISQDTGVCLSSMTSLGDVQPTLSNHCGPFHSALTTWHFDPSLGRLSANVVDHDSFTISSYCLGTRNDDAQSLSLTSCGENFVPLTVVRYPLRPQPKATTTVSAHSTVSPLITTGTWKCPKSGLEFPRNLNTVLGDDKDHVLMGGDLFTKTVYNIKFKVYTVAWYAEVEGLRKDPTMQAFKDRPASELSKDPSFFEAMVAPANYDRSLYIKLAMKLKCEMMLQGLMDDLLMKDHNKAQIAEASRSHASDICPYGLNMVFTWRKPQASNGFKDTLEMRFDGKLVASLNNDDEARDLLLQFVVPDPVAPVAKLAFADNFPLVLNSFAQESSPVDLDNDSTSSGSAAAQRLPDIPRVFSKAGRVLSAVAMMS